MGSGDARRPGDSTRERPALPRTLLQCPFPVPVEFEAWLRPWLALLASVGTFRGPFLIGDLGPLTLHSLCMHRCLASLGSDCIVVRTASPLWGRRLWRNEDRPGL